MNSNPTQVIGGVSIVGDAFNTSKKEKNYISLSPRIDKAEVKSLRYVAHQQELSKRLQNKQC